MGPFVALALLVEALREQDAFIGHLRDEPARLLMGAIPIQGLVEELARAGIGRLGLIAQGERLVPSPLGGLPEFIGAPQGLGTLHVKDWRSRRGSVRCGDWSSRLSLGGATRKVAAERAGGQPDPSMPSWKRGNALREKGQRHTPFSTAMSHTGSILK